MPTSSCQLSQRMVTTWSQARVQVVSVRAVCVDGAATPVCLDCRAHAQVPPFQKMTPHIHRK
eukprot:4976839-Pyramimonas_sp.AAC.1